MIATTTSNSTKVNAFTLTSVSLFLHLTRSSTFYYSIAEKRFYQFLVTTYYIFDTLLGDNLIIVL